MDTRPMAKKVTTSSAEERRILQITFQDHTRDTDFNTDKESITRSARDIGL